MRVETLKRPEKRFSTPNITNLGIQAWGKDNLYPVRVTDIVDSSSTADGCLRRYIKFLVGDGFSDSNLENLVVNEDSETLGDILSLAGEDLGRYGGASLLLNYNVLGKVTEIYHVPFLNCRLEEYDKNGRCKRVCIFADWTGSKKYDGKFIKPQPDTVTWVDRFDPKPEAIQWQMAEAGGADMYNGQVLWYSNGGKNAYPRPKYDAGITEISTDEGLANIAYRTVRSGFYTAGAFIIRKGQSTPKDDERIDLGPEPGSIEFKIMQLQGDTNLNKMAVLELDYDEQMPEFMDFGGKNYDKDFSVTNDNVVERIYAVFEQEGFHRIRKGSVGFNSDMLAQVYEYYNSVTSSERRQLERVFVRALENWHEPITSNVEIKPLVYVTNESTNGSLSNIFNEAISSAVKTEVSKLIK